MYAGSQTQMFAEYNCWLNEKLYVAAASLSDQERKADRGAFFKSLHATLEHILWGDTSWLGRFKGQPVALPPVGAPLFETFDVLWSARRVKDREIVEWAAEVTPDWLARPFTWTSVIYQRTFTQPGFAVVAQFFNHQTHHRGQATTLLSQLGVELGVTDIPLLPALNGE